jgi:predicted transcriptional regulator
LTQAQLRAQFEDGKTVAEIAEAEGRTLAQVRSALRADARERLADEVRDGDLTQAQADEALEHLDEHLERIGELGGDRGGFRGPHGFRGP